MSNQTTHTSILATSHSDLSKRINVSGILVSGVILLLGVLAFAATSGLEDKASSTGMSLLVLGSVLILFGIFRMFLKAKTLVYLPTGSKVKQRSVFFDTRDLNRLTELVNTGEFSAGHDLKSVASSNVRLDTIVSKDQRFAAVQLFQFIPYTYQPVTAVCYFTGEKALEVAATLAKVQLK